jgi:hypothetical protein
MIPALGSRLWALGGSGLFGSRYTRGVPQYTEPTVIWRMHRRNQHAHATIFSAAEQATVTWFFDGMMDRVENYDTLDLALARAEDIKRQLLEDGWRDD